ncbi:phage baseplate assembly protein V [Sinorhizobium sp. BG8]|uniref:phage baseplate assembly protein V n=1 Tax=Sinorhizobium sp. BG8 TaxID=2613773 RepID=UPI00193CB934|nr:phage baseplate assembly protein V [Sinorhizobium sp. BG8]QRM54371.1 hypothetical protein F3Y30_07280 [Sinorhizobium sp. BG8]
MNDFPAAAERNRSHYEPFYGKYRGIATDVNDPNQLGRIKARIPSLLEDFETGWATPCAPYGGTTSGFFSLPPIGAGVWIEFEGGDISRPIFAGCYWGLGEAPMAPPASPADPMTKVWRSELGLTIALDDKTQTITLSDPAGANQIVLNVRESSVTLRGITKVVFESAKIFEGSAVAFHPAVHGDQLMTYLNTLVTIFNTHMHVGQMAAGILPVTPAPSVVQMMPPPPSLLSTKVTLD